VLHLFVRTLGCRTNLADSAQVVDCLDQTSVKIVRFVQEADVVLLNTCTVTHKADRNVRKIVGSLGCRYPDLPVVVTGCAVVRDKIFLEDFPNVRAVLPASDPAAIARVLCKNSVSPLESTSSGSAFFRLGRSRALLKVQDGCNSFCTYCIVPQVRGRQRSVSLVQAVTRLRGFLAQGHREVVLTGIHLGRYGHDRGSSLVELLDRLAIIFQTEYPDCRLRLSSIEPQEWTVELVDRIQAYEFVCRHFHVPLQSGDDAILKAMGRSYTAKEYRAVLDRLRHSFSHAALGCDLLVGFPGEEEKNHAHNLEAVRSWGLDYLHVFTYSPRPGTLAKKMLPQVPVQTAKKRAAELRLHGEENWQKFLEAGLGQRHWVLIEKITDLGLEGLSEHFCKFLLVDGTCAKPGDLVTARAYALAEQILVGKVV
jgi:threonylcarbamoyladenosine tRNA methylthiotransferase MtaB